MKSAKAWPTLPDYVEKPIGSWHTTFASGVAQLQKYDTDDGQFYDLVNAGYRGVKEFPSERVRINQ